LHDSGADTRPACELHTHRLWQSHADAYRYSNSYSHADSYANCHSNSYAYTDSYANCHSNSYAYTDSYSYGNSDSYAYTDSYAYVDAYGPAETKPDTKVISDTAASPIVGSGSEK